MTESEIPSFSVPRILALRDRLMDAVFYSRFDVTPEGGEIDAIVAELRRQLPADISQDALFETVRQLAGNPLTEGACQRFSWMVAGNLPRLKAGLSVASWSVQQVDEWVPLQIIRATPTRNHKNEFGVDFEYRVLAGSPCPMKIRRFWSRKFCIAFARRIGFTPPYGNMPFTDGAQYVSLRLLGKIEVAKSRNAPVFFEVRCPSGCLEWNKELLKKRFHIIPCPNGWTHSCANCMIGYETCPAATHARTYIDGPCDRCGKTMPHDPEALSAVCVMCTREENLRRRFQ